MLRYKGSKSYDKQPNGMSEEKEEQLRSNGNLFQEPDSTLLLSSGCGRHWPDARGIFHNEDENFFVWVRRILINFVVVFMFFKGETAILGAHVFAPQKLLASLVAFVLKFSFFYNFIVFEISRWCSRSAR